MLGIEALKTQLANKRTRVNLRYTYYNQKNIVRDFHISTPPELWYFTSALGWCSKAVDSMADRLQFNGFKNDEFGINEIFKLNNSDIFFNDAIQSALIGSCSFVYISADENEYPRLQVIDGTNATGTLDPITKMLTEGYAVLERDDKKQVIAEAYFLPYRTEYYFYDGRENFAIETNCPYPLLVPVIYKADADNNHAFGHSRITRACMSLQDGALRTIKRSEIGAEFFAYPQKYITGLSEDFEIDKWKASMSSMLMFTNDEDGNHPIMGQFATQSMTPHLEQLKMFASAFAGETGLTLDDLGWASGNPSSSDAIKAAHENLRLASRKAQKTFGSYLLNVGIVAACLRDNYPYERNAFYDSEAKWMPVFEADGSALSGMGDAIIKIQQSFPDYFTAEKLETLIGI